MALRWFVLAILLGQVVTGLHVRLHVKNGKTSVHAHTAASTSDSDSGINYLLAKAEALVNTLSEAETSDFDLEVPEERSPQREEVFYSKMESFDVESTWDDSPSVPHAETEEVKEARLQLRNKKKTILEKINAFSGQQDEDMLQPDAELDGKLLFLQVSEQSHVHISTSSGVASNMKWPERYECNPPKRHEDLNRYQDHLVFFLAAIHSRIDRRAKQLRELTYDAQPVLDLKSLDFLSHWDIDYLLQELGPESIPDESNREPLARQNNPVHAVQVLKVTLLYMRLVVLEKLVEETFAIQVYRFLSSSDVQPANNNLRRNIERTDPDESGDYIFNDISAQCPSCSSAFGAAHKLSAHAWVYSPSFVYTGDAGTTVTVPKHLTRIQEKSMLVGNRFKS